MIKLVLFSFFLLFGTISLAQTKSPVIERARQHRLELVQKQDELLELLLQIPFEQRQYIFPLLSAKKSVPKKIKTHPEVLVWKGKKPTRIADRFKDDVELIQYLPEQFYYLLAPEAWPESELPILETNPHQILQQLTQQTEASELSVMPEELMDIYDGLVILQEWVKQQAKQPASPLSFEKWVTEIPEQIRQKIQEKTSLPAETFGAKTDRIAKSYRLYQQQKTPPVSSEQKLVQEYWSLIPFLFQKTGFKDTLDTQLYSD